MIRYFTLLSAALLLLTIGVQTAQPAKPSGCQNTRLRWEMRPAYDGFTSGITSDGNAYADGSSGVQAVINVCSGSGDATLQVSAKGKNPRKVSFNFANSLAIVPGVTPAWASGIVTGAANINVRKLAFEFSPGDRNTDYIFTTWMGSTPPAPSGSWGFHMLHPVTDANVGDPSDPNFPTANDPYLEAPVIVQHCKAGSTAVTGPCVGVTKETWFVYPDPSEINDVPNAINVGELINKSNLSSPVNAGQFSMPFYFVISVL